MSVPVPLGVRFFTVVSAGEWWVTRWVEDVTFRSVVPGGFASATITLHVPRDNGFQGHSDPLGFSRINELFTRVQVVDLRTMEVAWEGRVEDPARQTEPDTWQIGALGSMVAATDITRPVFYVDTGMDRWVTGATIAADGLIWENIGITIWSTEKDDTKRSVVTNYNGVGYQLNSGNTVDYSWRWDSHGFDQAIARFTTTHDGICTNTTEAGRLSVLVGIAANAAIDVTAFTSAEATKSNVIGTDFTDQNARFIVFGARQNSSFYDINSSDTLRLQMRNPKVVGMRQDRFGNHLTTAANYTTDHVTVAQVVEDVLGRFLVGGWYEGGISTPWPGSVRPTDAYIDASDTTQILHLAYPDGATAADILNDLASQVQTNAYWAIWESKWGAINPNSDNGLLGFRFEWATWPANWGYLASSQDGFEGQPNGDDVYNFISYRYPDSNDSNVYHVLTTWQGTEMAPELYEGGFTRAVMVDKSDPTDEPTAQALRTAYLKTKKRVDNAGTLTIRRPIQFFDAGVNSQSGGGRMLDPWMLRPGKLIRVTDLPPRGGLNDMSYGHTPPSEALNGTVFRVVATEYHSSDNSCRLELDQVATWQIPTQIEQAGSGNSTIRTQ